MDVEDGAERTPDRGPRDAPVPPPEAHAPGQPPAAQPPGAQPPGQYRLRRAPRYRSFGLTGVVAGAVVGLIVAYSQPAVGDYSSRTIAGYFGVSCALIGGLAGLAAALLLERWRS